MGLRVEIGSAVSALEGQEVSGDAVLVVESGAALIAGIVDGLGHGASAAEAATAFRQAVEQHAGLPPEGILWATEKVMSRTRGAVAALVRVDRDRGTLSYAGVGNTSFVARCARSMHATSLPGILGRLRRSPVRFDFQLSAGDLIGLHSDGLSSIDLSLVEDRDLSEAAREFLDTRGRSDDRSCLLMRFARDP